MAQIGVVPDQVVTPDIDETPRRNEVPRLYAARMAIEKAQRAAETGASTQTGAYILAADTVVALGTRIMPKAADCEDVRACMALLSGRRHHVLTALALIGPDGRVGRRLSDSVVAFSRLAAAQLDAYAMCEEGIGKAGGYAIQGRAAGFVRFMSGSYSGVVGLPLFEVAQLLRGRGYAVP